MGVTDTTTPADAPVVAWREHVEQRIRTWQQRTMNKSGDRLSIDDFMGQESVDDLVDFVCDEHAYPADHERIVADLRAQLQAAEQDALRLDWFDEEADKGHAPSLVYDDNGHFAVPDAGMQPMPDGDKFTETVSIVSIVEPHQWHDSPRAAIDAAMQESKQ